MARITEKGLSGRVGPIIYYERDGKQYARSRPMYKKKRSRAKETDATSIFGVCSTASSSVGQSIRTRLKFAFGLPSFNALRGWVKKQYSLHFQESDWPMTNAYISPCQLNQKSDLRDYFFVPLEVRGIENGKLNVYLPSFDPAKQIVAPANTQAVIIRLILSGLPFAKQGLSEFHTEEEIKIRFADGITEAKNLLLENEGLQPGAIIMLTVALEFEIHEGVLFHAEKYLPAAVVAMGRVGAL